MGGHANLMWAAPFSQRRPARSGGDSSSSTARGTPEVCHQVSASPSGLAFRRSVGGPSAAVSTDRGCIRSVAPPVAHGWRPGATSTRQRVHPVPLCAVVVAANGLWRETLRDLRSVKIGSAASQHRRVKR